MRARFRRTRSTRPPNPDSASGDASPRTYGLFRNQLFNDDASRNRAELEPIDYLTRSTTPHAGHVTIALTVVAITVALWLTLGSIDQSLWLTGRLLERLLSGREVSVFRNTYAGAFLSGTIHGVHREGQGGNPGRTDTLHLDVAYEPALFEPPSQGEANYRLRISVGSQRPIDLLLRLARPGLSREP